MEVSFLPELISAFADTFLVLSISPSPCPPERFWVNTHFYEYAINHFFLKASDGRLFAYLRQFFSEREEILTQTPVAKPSSEILSRIYKRCVRQAENRMSKGARPAREGTLGNLHDYGRERHPSLPSWLLRPPQRLARHNKNRRT